jgi:glycosyltransferase involved in cell wall biosynthesis
MTAEETNHGPSDNRESSQTVVVAAKLHANQLERHLELLERLETVGRILVVRHEPLPKRLQKIENFDFRGGSVPMSALRMLRRLEEVLSTQQVDWVLGFNPVPWGSLGHLVARRYGSRSCLSLIGRDFLQLQEPWALPFLQAVRKSDRVTVTGAKMAEGLAKRGVDPHGIHVLPHSVDIERFRPLPIEKRFDVVSVGQLIRRKRMDVLIEATRLLALRGLRLRVGILGKGPEEAALRAQIARAGLADQIELLPYRNDVENLLAEAQAFVLASEWEGVPFALMEAMATGLVPVVTNVGTISDWVTHGKNGLLVPVGDAQALARSFERLFGPQSEDLPRLAQTVRDERARLSFDSGVEVWRKILT